MKEKRHYGHRTLKILWGRSGNLCAFPGCSQILVAQSTRNTFSIIGDMAHIIAASEDGPRGKSEELDRNDVANIILLCPTHHRIVDQDPSQYPPEKLHRWKRDHERAVIDAALSRTSRAVCDRLHRILKPEPREESLQPKRYIKIRFRSEKLQYQWEYDVDAGITCKELANALAEQHFSPFHKSFVWLLSDQSGKMYPPEETLRQALPMQQPTVLLRMIYSARPLDPAYGLPHEWQYWIHELACSGDFIQYISKGEGLIRQYPKNLQHLNMLAWMYLEANRNIDRAETLLQRCLDISESATDDPAILDTLGWLDYRMHRYEQAEWKLWHALDQTPDSDGGYFVTLYHLYFTWRALGQNTSADRARTRIHSWLSDYGQDMLIRKRVTVDNDSLLIPKCPYLDPCWLGFFEIKRLEEGWWRLEASP